MNSSVGCRAGGRMRWRFATGTSFNRNTSQRWRGTAWRNTDQVALYRTGIIPQAQQSFDASLAAYQVGKLELLSLLDSLMTLYRYQIDYQRALTDALRDAARLEAATGSSLAP
jgi:hypothetical protein